VQTRRLKAQKQPAYAQAFWDSKFAWYLIRLNQFTSYHWLGKKEVATPLDNNNKNLFLVFQELL